MDTLLILRDTITANVVKVVDSCQPCIQEAETNWQDVVIVKYVCYAIVAMFLTIVFAVGIFVWHNNKWRKMYNIAEENHKLKEKDDKIKELEKSIEAQKKDKKKKEEYEIACEVLDKISSLARPKDGITDKEVANKLFSLYQSIKNDIHEKTGTTSSEG